MLTIDIPNLGHLGLSGNLPDHPTTFPDDPKCPKFGTSIVSTAYGAYLDHADAQNLAKPPFMRICRELENWRDLRALSRKFLRQKSCYPESFRFL